jgi:hypothetical protein
VVDFDVEPGDCGTAGGSFHLGLGLDDAGAWALVVVVGQRRGVDG